VVRGRGSDWDGEGEVLINPISGGVRQQQQPALQSPSPQKGVENEDKKQRQEEEEEDRLEEGGEEAAEALDIDLEELGEVEESI
jgi:hypothetical protein